MKPAKYGRTAEEALFLLQHEERTLRHAHDHERMRHRLWRILALAGTGLGLTATMLVGLDFSEPIDADLLIARVMMCAAALTLLAGIGGMVWTILRGHDDDLGSLNALPYMLFGVAIFGGIIGGIEAMRSAGVLS